MHIERVSGDVAMTAADSMRLWTAALVALLYLGLCAPIYLAQWRKYASRSAASGGPARAPSSAAWIVAYASQTGSAEALAAQTAETLRLAGLPCQLRSLSSLAADDLAQAERILFVVSTYGEGDPPDNAALFASRLADLQLPLADLHYAVLALGDSSYPNFCGFGKALERVLRERGAQALFDRIDVDRCDAAAIAAWWHRIGRLAGTSDVPDWSGPEFGDWILAERRLLNPGSAGHPVFHIALEPTQGEDGAAFPEWQSGDLAQILVPAEPERPREYSIASLPTDGRVHLLIRLHRQPGGGTGAASGWLCKQAQTGTAIKMRVRAHRRFRLEDNAARPLILIGNGTGIAGLRAHLKARASHGRGRNWLIFGERNAASDFHYRAEIEAWQAEGLLQHTHIVFSRDQAERRYVQHCVAESGEGLRDWVGQGAAIYVCGSLAGMASGVDAALKEVLGGNIVEQLALDGRYRRDVY
jgi:sulfite reductase (NADPH) flavoprotein alpha-component